VGQLTRLVDDLLDVSRITQGRIELQPEVLDLASIVEQALESVEPLMSAKGHIVMRQAHLPTLHVRGDRTRLVQCISIDLPRPRTVEMMSTARFGEYTLTIRALLAKSTGSASTAGSTA